MPKTDGAHYDGFISLSPKEREVAGYVAQGLTNRAITERMGYHTDKNVQQFLRLIYSKVGTTADPEYNPRVRLTRIVLGVDSLGELDNAG